MKSRAKLSLRVVPRAQVKLSLNGQGVPRDMRQAFYGLCVNAGGKALRRAIVDCFGALALVPRCHEHKRRNVIEHLPQELHASVGRAVRDASDGGNAELARKQLQRLAASLNAKHPGAAASLREGLEETLTVQALGITGALY